MIEIDGSYGEGGGQILRSSIALSAITGIPLCIHHIRAQRSKPGLRPQHLAAVQAVSKLTNAKITSAFIGSNEITLAPSAIRSGKYRVDIPTAGALTLVFQTIFLPLSFADGASEITLTGGTHVPWSPVFHYIDQHWLPIMRSLGYRAEFLLHQAGFYPQGGGLVKAKILPAKPIMTFQSLQCGDLVRIRGVSGVANLDDAIAKRQKHRVLQRLYPLCNDTKIQTQRFISPGMGSFVCLQAEFSAAGSAAFSVLGAKGKRAEFVADEAVDKLLAFLETGGCIDPHLADQLLLPLLFTPGESVFRVGLVTSHLLTNAYVIEHFLPDSVSIDGVLGGPGIVRVKGRVH